MKTNYKVLAITPLIALTMGACKSYQNTVIMIKGNKVLLTDEAGQERLVDCSKKNSTYPTLQKDIPYFHKGDVINFAPARGYTYEGFRAYTIEGSKFDYNKDSIQIRKDMEKIAEFKADTISKQYVR